MLPGIRSAQELKRYWEAAAFLKKPGRQAGMKGVTVTMKNNARRSLALLLCLILVVQLVPAVSAAEVASGSSGAAVWSLDDAGVLTVSGGEMENYASAAEQPWAAYAQQIQKVVIGSGVTRVGDYAFADCVNLTEVSIGGDVTTIGICAFENTTSLTEAVMPKNVKVFCDGMFHNSGLKKLYVLSRYTEFEGFYSVGSDEDNVLPLDTVIYCYDCSHAYFYFNRKNVVLTDDPAINIDNGSSTIPLDQNNTHFVRDLWLASETKDALVFDYSFSMNTRDALRIHNEMVAEGKQIGPDYRNNGKLEVEVQISLRDQHDINDYTIRAGADYAFCEYDLEGTANSNYGTWDCWSNEEQFVTVTGGADSVSVSINATMQELAAYFGEPVSSVFIYVSIAGISHTYNGRYESVDKTTTVESSSITVYDAHLRDSWVEYDWNHTLDEQLVVEDWAPYEYQMTPEEYARYYEPVERHYSWIYEFKREGWFTDEATGEEIHPGEGFWELEGDGIVTEVYNGTVYGGLRGSYDAGADPSISIREILSEEELAFVETLQGVKAQGLGGEATISLYYTLTMTFADGAQVVMEGNAADEGSALIGICPHTCSVCGMCTAEENLACNTGVKAYRENSCVCEEPQCNTVCTLLPADQVGFIDETWDQAVKVRVEEIQPTTDSPYVHKTLESLMSYSVISLFDISVYREDGTPYILNEWGGEEEKLTITVPVKKRAAVSFEVGDALLFHVKPGSPPEQIPVTYSEEDGTITFTGTSFSPYVLVETAGFYGRRALAKLENATGLLYAYDQLAKGVETAQEVIEVYNGIDPVSLEEFDAVMSAYLRDYVAHFWCNDTYLFGGTEDCIKVVKPSYAMTGAELEAAMDEFEEATQKILAGITPGMSDYAKEQHIHDMITSQVVYDLESPNAHNAYGALVEGRAVCDGYSEGFGYLLQRMGIQTFQALGSSINPGTGAPEPHSWTYVRLEGNYYHVDTTWDSQVDEIFHMYFNQNDAEMLDDHTPKPTAFALPVCDSREAFYFEGKVENLETYTVDIISNLMKENGNKVHVYIASDPEVFYEWLSMNVGAIRKRLGVSGTFKCRQVGREFSLALVASTAELSGTISGNAGQTTVSLFKGETCVATVTANGSEKFSFKNVNPGEYTVRLEAEGFFVENVSVTVGSNNLAIDLEMYRKGDINGDGKVSNKDVTRLLQHLAGWSVDTLEKALDVNNDGKVNNRDATRLLQYLAGWEVTIYE